MDVGIHSSASSATKADAVPMFARAAGPRTAPDHPQSVEAAARYMLLAALPLIVR